MELCEGGDLQLFRSEGPGAILHAAEQLELMEQASAGCAWIAAKGFVHRDVKMQNILIAKRDAFGNAKYTPKIADLGLAERRTMAAMGNAGTRAYMAPECHRGQYTEKSDVYGFGHVMLRTFCTARDKVGEPGEVEMWLHQEWKKTDHRVAEQHCRGAQLPLLGFAFNEAIMHESANVGCKWFAHLVVLMSFSLGTCA
eukprot:5493733-Amphidinium_carterae.2